jgi:hypothetical protein
MSEVTKKKCSKCKEEKSLDCFYKDKQKKDGHNSHCKVCELSSKKTYYKENKDKVKEYQKENKDKLKETRKLHKEKNKDKLKDYSKKYYEKNKDKIKEKDSKYQKKRKDNDPLYKLTCNLRSSISVAIKKGKGFKYGKSEELLGCTFDEVREHLENQFTEGMTWENHGLYGWHIDHIKPCDVFDLSDESQQRECFHYTNLQPLWAKDNLEKSNKWEEPTDDEMLLMEDFFE